MLVDLIKNVDVTLTPKITFGPYFKRAIELPYYFGPKATSENSVVIVSNKGDAEKNLLMGIIDLYNLPGIAKDYLRNELWNSINKNKKELPGLKELGKVAGDYMKNEEVKRALTERIEELRKIHLIKEEEFDYSKLKN